jgi:hypothetical protein
LEWVELESSALAAVAYPEQEQLLFAEFRTGEVYLYVNVAREEFVNLLGADSRGRYFNSRIRDRFRHLRLGLYRQRN